MPQTPISVEVKHTHIFGALENFNLALVSALQRQVGVFVEVYDSWLQIQPCHVSEQLLCLATVHFKIIGNYNRRLIPKTPTTGFCKNSLLHYGHVSSPVTLDLDLLSALRVEVEQV